MRHYTDEDTHSFTLIHTIVPVLGYKMESSNFNELLIAAVQERRALYDKTEDNYSNRVFINKQWKEIGEELGIDEQTARRKWTCMRDYFQKQHKQLNNVKSGALPNKKKKWYLYDNMSFLLPFVTQRSSGIFSDDEDVDPNKDNMDDEDDDAHSHTSSSSLLNMPSAVSNSTEINSVKKISQPDDWQSLVDKRREPPRVKRLKQMREREIPTSFDPQMMATMKEMGEKIWQSRLTEDEDELFFKSLIPKLKILDPIMRMECQAEIHAVVLRHMKRSSGCQSQSHMLESLPKPSVSESSER